MIGALLQAFLALLVNPVGWFLFLLGLLGFLLLPVASLISGVKKFAYVHLWLALWANSRSAPTLSEHGDLLWKQMSFDDLGVETISFGGERKEFSDPDGALHTWMGFPFALADEVHGVLFDPRHAAIGERKYEHDLEGTGEIEPTRAEYDEYQVLGWKPGVFDLPRTAFDLVDLTKVRQLVDGTERSDDPQRAEEYYKYKVAPDGNRLAFMKMLLPVIAFVVVLGTIYIVKDQMSAGGAGPTVTGLAILGLTAAEDVDYRQVGGIGLVALPPLAIVAGLLLLYPPVLAVIGLLLLGMGFLFLPMITLLGRPSKIISGGLSKYVYFKLGLFAWNRPTWVWTPGGYELHDAADLETTDTVSWYSMLGHVVGFTYEPGEESFRADAIAPDELRARIEKDTSDPKFTDGGAMYNASTDDERQLLNLPTKIPAGWTRWPGKVRGLYGAYAPSERRIDDDRVYVRTGIALSRLIRGATGEKTKRRLDYAREKYGDGDFGLSDSTLLWMTMGSIVLAAALGTWVFFL